MSNQLVELTLTPSQAATFYCLKKQAIATDEGAIGSFAVERSQLLEKFTPEQLGKQLLSEELNLIANYQESLTEKDNCTHLLQLLSQPPRSHRKKGSKVGRTQLAFDDEPKKSRHLALTATAIEWLDSIASDHQINRNGVIELWARGEIVVSPPSPNPHAITTVRTNPRSLREDRMGYEFDERKNATNVPLTDTAMDWLETIANNRKINRSDLINLWAIGAEPLPSNRQPSSSTSEFKAETEDAELVVAAGQARKWYEIATQKDDQPLVDRINALGTTLKQLYNQQLEGDGLLLPPPEYTHPTVTISVAEHRQLETTLAVGQDAIIPQQSAKRELVL
jgi:hypothetical protein